MSYNRENRYNVSSDIGTCIQTHEHERTNGDGRACKNESIILKNGKSDHPFIMENFIGPKFGLIRCSNSKGDKILKISVSAALHLQTL